MHRTAMFPGSETRFRALVVLVALATIVLGLVVWQFWPDNTQEEFARAAKALATVRSFRYEYADLAGARPNRESREIACPARQHVTIASGDGGLWEYIQVDGRSFYNAAHSGGWKEYSNEFDMDLGLNPRILCQRIAAGQDTGPFPLYAMLLKRGFATRGEIKQLEGGGQCREWIVQVPIMGIQDDSESFCLDTETYLPVYRLTASGRYSFSAFNAPLTIEVPRVTAASQ